MAGGKVEHGGTQHVRSRIRVKFDETANACGLGRESQARHVYQVAPDVHEGSSSVGEDVADVLWITVKVAEITDNRADSADPAPSDQLEDPSPLRMGSHHESLIFIPVRSRASSSFCLLDGQAIGFSHRTCLPASMALIDHGT